MRSLVIALCLLSSALFAAAPQATLDNGTIKVIIPNNGSFAFDAVNSLYGGPGLFFPSNYSIDLMGGAGVWVAGKVEDEWRVSIAGGASEFVPGPAYSYDTLAPEFPVFHVSRLSDQDLNDDYRQWPAHLGAPTDSFGRPQFPGVEAAYTVFADTDTLSHGFNISNSLPLGIEGRLFVYTFDNVSQVFDTLLSQVVFLEYSLTNITASQIDSCIVTIYADPDIGYSRDDLVASDSAAQGAFLYQSSGYDTYFGYNPPVVGLAMLSERLASTNFYHFRSEYDTLPQTVDLMLGRDLEGNPYTDSTTGRTTHFPYNGYPESDSGWLMEVVNDYRLMLNLAPRDLAPGETVDLKAALIVARGEDVPGSVRGWRRTAALLHQLEAEPPRVELYAAAAPVAYILGPPLEAHNWGGRYLHGGLDLASRYFGLSDVLPEYFFFRVRFDQAHSQAMCRFAFDGNDWRFQERVELPLWLTSLSDSYDLELGWLDQNNDGSWTGDTGLLEPLLLYERKVSDPPAAQVQAEDASLLLQLDETPSAVLGLTINLIPDFIGFDFRPAKDSITFGPVGLGSTVENTLQISNQFSIVQHVTVSVDAVEGLSAYPTSLDLGAGESGLVFLQYHPTESSGFNTRLIVRSLGYTLIADTLSLASWTVAPANAGDLNNSGELDLSDIVLLVRALYDDSDSPPPLDNCDSDCDTDFDLVDLVRFINHFFYGTELTCR